MLRGSLCSRTATRHQATSSSAFFFFNAAATPEIYTLSLHDALPIFGIQRQRDDGRGGCDVVPRHQHDEHAEDRKSTRLNSSHTVISYAVFCLKKKKNRQR